MQLRVLGMIMAGGKGTRLHPLTRDRAKPAVPFGGKFRIIDFALSNFINSGIYGVYVLTQFMSQSLTEHLQFAWSFNSLLREHFITAVPAQMRTGDAWYRGTADAIYQNLNLIRESRPHLVCVFGGDHVYRMDLSQMLQYHEHNEADCTVAAIPVPIEEASAFGVIEIDEDRRVVGWQEKPKHPKPIPGDPAHALASMGNYVFSCRSLVSCLEADAVDERSSHDFGKDVIPKLISEGRVYCYDFTTNRVPGEKGPNTYWRDVGTLDAYYEANMDLREVVPAFNLYNRHWPIRTARYDDPPAKFVHDAENRTGRAVN
jgi:glucose-1-phosphate adenylyltransferase